MATKTKTAKTGPKAKTTRAPAKSKAQLAALAAGARLKRVGDKEFDLSDYQAVKSAGGNSSLDNGDSVAKKLRGMGLEDVYREYARVFGKDDAAAMRKRYKDLNPGMQRMNLGNRIRAASSAKAA